MPVVVEVLGLEIQEYESDIDFYGRKIRTKGYVDLDWGLIKSRPTFRTRFLVVQQGNPRFDIVLGRRAALDYGLIDSGCSSTPASQPVRMISRYEKGFRAAGSDGSLEEGILCISDLQKVQSPQRFFKHTLHRPHRSLRSRLEKLTTVCIFVLMKDQRCRIGREDAVEFQTCVLS
ncbi:hypothetical protein BKA80DRAFT_251483 [Phyllosticta citrichinensis]